MTQRRVLYITMDGNGAGAPGLAVPGWQLCPACGLRDAARQLGASDFVVGLLSLNCGIKLAEFEAFLREQAAVLWVGLAPPGLLDHASWRELAAAYLADFHTLPVDAARLAHTLGHAYGCAMLRAAPQPRAERGQATLLTGHSAAIAQLRAQVAKVARVNAPVLIWGESGSGKELTAQAIHSLSPRQRGPFVPINCGAVPGGLIQSELFGHVRGAFTGADRDKPGLIESATGGTVFLDEIADLPRDLQGNLLRFLQEKTISRIGSNRSTVVDARVIAASNVNLEAAVARGDFREDLFYRLNVLTIDVPALRERQEDVPVLAELFFRTYAADRPARLRGFSSAALRALLQHRWPGNVRELLNRTRRAMVMAEGRLIEPHDLGLEAGTHDDGDETLGAARLRAERNAIRASLDRDGGNITQAARTLGVSRMTLYRLIDKHGIQI
jgi:DNA-binding NtrC family response regulator